tara:strand:- start:931 stop:1716 length:786 start_codon:yes stop_codon:yes gene_type:complete
MSLIEQYGLEENHKPEEGEVVVQDSQKPKEGFDGNIGDDQDVAKPATVQLDAPSDDDPGTTTKNDGHQTVTVSNEGEDDGEPKGEPVGPHGDTDDAADPATAEVEPEPSHADNGDVEGDKPGEGSDEQVTADVDPKDTHVLPEDTAGPNTTISNEQRKEEAEQAVATLNRFAVAVEGYTTLAESALEENGGLSRDMAQAIKLGIETFDTALSNDQVVPALENFGEVASRKSTTENMLKRLKSTHDDIITARDAAQQIVDGL